MLGEVVYVGELGLKGGGGASGSGEPQGEVSDPAEQGNGKQTEQETSSEAQREALASSNVAYEDASSEYLATPSSTRNHLLANC